MTEQRWWKVGELARATGLTVRTLHHWDEIGLVTPERTASGHRCYRSADLARLYQVVTLRRMGLGLEAIAALLADEDPDPRHTLRRHLEAVEWELRRNRELRDRLAGVLGVLERGDANADTELLEVIERMTMFENELTADQRAWFVQRREQVGEQRWQAGLDEWPRLIAGVRAEMDAGTDPGDPKVVELAARWGELAKLFLGDDAEFRTAAGEAWRKMWGEHEQDLRQSPSIAPPEMWDYVQRAQRSG